MGNSTLGLWMAMAAIDPWDENRADERAARVATAAMNGPHWKKENGAAYEVEDFVPYHDAQQDPAEVAARKEREMAAQLRASLLNASGHKAKGI